LTRIALAGNPNAGKTTLFNRLTGSQQKVANYSGVTVEVAEGRFVLARSGSVSILDVPGCHSLTARSREEELAIEVIAGLPPFAAPDLTLLVIDASQLARSLYLALQVLELPGRVVVALNMSDLIAARGLEVDVRVLERELGVPVVAVSALHNEGLDELRAAMDRALRDEHVGTRPQIDEPQAVQGALEELRPLLPAAWNTGDERRGLALARWALLSLEGEDELAGIPQQLRERALRLRAQGSLDEALIRARYAWIDARLPSCLRTQAQPRVNLTERVDAILLNPAAGFALFLLLMGLVFQSLFSWSDPAIGAIEDGFAALSGWCEGVLSPGLLRDFLVGGVIAGVGSVVVFLPQILLLFLFIGILEDTGYMARVAYLMDRIMRLFGLSGRAFVPMLSGYACAVPAILATRTMERARDRHLTMLVIPLMTCSARLPVYTLIIATLFPAGVVLGFLPVQGLLMVAMYLFSTLMALAAAAVLSRTVLKGKSLPLILELPPYRMPHWGGILRMMLQRSRAFLAQAGGMILVCSIVLWALLTIRSPWADAPAPAASEQGTEAVRAEELRSSLAGQMGHAIEPAIEPLGFDWKIGVGLIGAFAAREVFVSTMGVVYGVGGEVDEGSASLREKIQSEQRSDGTPLYTPLMGLSLMIFFALACQCMSTLGAVYRETKSLKWPIFLFGYMTALAWLASFAVYQGGRALGFA
jgi:ferrous iron transport protein B